MSDEVITKAVDRLLKQADFIGELRDAGLISEEVQKEMLRAALEALAS